MNKSLLKSFGIKIMPTFGFLKNATGAAVNESASEILKDVDEIKKNNLPIIEHPNRKLRKITSAVFQPIDKITLAETEKKPNNVSIEHPDRQITKITAKLFYEECIQCGLRGKQASSNYSSHYVQNNLLYATAIHSLSCGPGPLHNNECAKCYQKLTKLFTILINGDFFGSETIVGSSISSSYFCHTSYRRLSITLSTYSSMRPTVSDLYLSNYKG